MRVRYRKRRTTRVLPFDHRNQDIEIGDLLIMVDNSVVRAVESRGRNKSAAGDLSYVELRPPERLRGAKAVAIDGVVWWELPKEE